MTFFALCFLLQIANNLINRSQLIHGRNVFDFPNRLMLDAGELL
jgi:hypothetical protein